MDEASSTPVLFREFRRLSVSKDMVLSLSFLLSKVYRLMKGYLRFRNGFLLLIHWRCF